MAVKPGSVLTRDLLGFVCCYSVCFFSLRPDRMFFPVKCSDLWVCFVCLHSVGFAAFILLLHDSPLWQ